MKKTDLRLITQKVNPPSDIAQHRYRELDAVAEGLMMELQIQSGQYLVFPLGDPKATSNKDAVKRWINRQVNHPTITREIYEDLKAQLKSKLTNFFDREI